GDLSAYLIGISSARDFLDTSTSYTSIRDPMVRLCHRLIAYSITGRSQALEKVTVTDLFYLRGMDFGSVNIPYLLDRYLRLFDSWRKRGAMISRGLADLRGLYDTLGLAPVQAPQQPPHSARPALTMAQRDLSRFTVWAAEGISHLLDSTGATYDLAEKKLTMLVKYLQSGNLEVLSLEISRQLAASSKVNAAGLNCYKITTA
ncbi:hypothetical protein Tco_1454839, partial [Tanacetum coccineum]